MIRKTLFVALVSLWRVKARTALAILAVAAGISIVLILTLITAEAIVVSGRLLQSSTIPLLILAGTALLLGGVASMALALVSVMERRREISIRKIHGATNGHILFQFLFETVIVTTLGGVLGLAGILAVPTIGSTVTASFSATLIIPLLLLVGIAMGGIVIGLPAAIKAARQRTLDGLQY